MEFVVGNLVAGATPWAGGTVDVAFCRNVLIHLDSDGVRAAARVLFDALAPGGWLITGPSDPPLGDLAPFVAVLTPGGIAWRRPCPDATEPATARAIEADAALPAPRAATPRASPRARAPATAGDLRAIADSSGTFAALAACNDALRRAPLSTELHVLRGILLVAAGRHAQAREALGRALYLDPTPYAVHALVATLAARDGDTTAARRAWRNARDLAAGRPADEPAVHGDGATAGDVLAAAEASLAVLGGVR